MSQPRSNTTRILAGDESLTSRIHPITINEIHAFLLGFFVGVLSARKSQPMISVIVGLYALFRPPIGNRSIGSKTLTHEPWYVLCGLLIGGIFGDR